MSTKQISIKPNNHRILQCPNHKKIELLNKLIKENSDSDILVVTSSDASEIIDNLEDKNIKVMEDRNLIKEKDLSCKFLISFDMPIKAIVYMARASCATEKAVMLLNESEQKLLHSIETLLGRVIKQESVEGFFYEVEAKKEETPSKYKKLSKSQITEIAKKRHEDATVEKKKSDKPKNDFKKDDSSNKWEKKKKAPNKFLGKDENGKAMFSGKSGERNHRYDGTPRDRYDAPKKVGKKINIKARKPKED